MKRGLLVICLGPLLMSLSCQSTVTGSGTLVEKTFQLDGFTGIKAGVIFHLKAHMDPVYKVSVKIDDNLEKYLRVTVSDKTLVLSMDPAKQYKANNDSMVVEIQSPRLDHLELGGAATGSISGFSNEKFSLILSGATKLSGDINTESLNVDASGASRMTLSGQVGQYRLELSGASKAYLFNLKAAKAQISLSGASNAEVYVTEELTLDASGACSLKYRGKPKLRSIKTSGVSSIEPMELPEQPSSK